MSDGAKQNEAFTPDPYLAGVAIAPGVKGQQETGVVAGQWCPSLGIEWTRHLCIFRVLDGVTKRTLPYMTSLLPVSLSILRIVLQERPSAVRQLMSTYFSRNDENSWIFDARNKVIIILLVAQDQ